MVKRCIIFIGEHEQLAQSIAGAYLRVRPDIKATSDSFTAELDNNINRMFGLLFGPEHYQDREEVLLPDFYGFSQTQVYDEFKKTMVMFGGPGVFGRVLGRRIRFNTAFNTFAFAGVPNNASLLAMQFEKSVGAENMLVVYINTACTLEAHEKFQLKDAMIREISVGDDKELLALLVKGCIKRFMNLED